MIWARCDGPRQIHPIAGTLHRLVESQQSVATLDYVDTLEEQALLESLLEESKPAPPWGGARYPRYHYLLRTPFRYPPLPWGSRFGSASEPSLFYGALSELATLAEAAYYRFVFFFSMAALPPKPAIHTQHTLFTARYRTKSGVQLQNAPFDHYTTSLTHPADYAATQRLGGDMRAAGVQAFEYLSARDPRHGICGALFSPAAFAARKPDSQQPWLCETSAATVSFKPVGGATVTSFALSVFLTHGRFPQPARR